MIRKSLYIVIISIFLNSFSCYSKDSKDSKEYPQKDKDFVQMVTEVYLEEVAFNGEERVKTASFSIIQKKLNEEDIKKIGVSVNRYSKILTIWAWNEEEQLYNIPYKSVLCSPNVRKTPTGFFYPQEFIGEWHEMFGRNNFCKYLIRFKGYYLFHSPIFWKEDNYSLKTYTYNGLGELESSGCIRLTTKDAHFLYSHLTEESPILIFDSAYSGPIEVEEIDKIDKNQTWDPTDPDISKNLDKTGQN